MPGKGPLSRSSTLPPKANRPHPGKTNVLSTNVSSVPPSGRSSTCPTANVSNITPDKSHNPPSIQTGRSCSTYSSNYRNPPPVFLSRDQTLPQLKSVANATYASKASAGNPMPGKGPMSRSSTLPPKVNRPHPVKTNVLSTNVSSVPSGRSSTCPTAKVSNITPDKSHNPPSIQTERICSTYSSNYRNPSPPRDLTLPQLKFVANATYVSKASAFPVPKTSNPMSVNSSTSRYNTLPFKASKPYPGKINNFPASVSRVPFGKSSTSPAAKVCNLTHDKSIPQIISNPPLKVNKPTIPPTVSTLHSYESSSSGSIPKSSVQSTTNPTNVDILNWKVPTTHPSRKTGLIHKFTVKKQRGSQRNMHNILPKKPERIQKEVFKRKQHKRKIGTYKQTSPMPALTDILQWDKQTSTKKEHGKSINRLRGQSNLPPWAMSVSSSKHPSSSGRISDPISYHNPPCPGEQSDQLSPLFPPYPGGPMDSCSLTVTEPYLQALSSPSAKTHASNSPPSPGGPLDVPSPDSPRSPGEMSPAHSPDFFLQFRSSPGGQSDSLSPLYPPSPRRPMDSRSLTFMEPTSHALSSLSAKTHAGVLSVHMPPSPGTLAGQRCPHSCSLQAGLLQPPPQFNYSPSPGGPLNLPCPGSLPFPVETSPQHSPEFFLQIRSSPGR